MSTSPKAATAIAESDFVITRVFHAPRELVWKAWTESEHLAHWWGPRICTCPVAEMDVRPGGAYRIVMRMPDMTDFPITGAFREVVKPERLVMTLDCTEHPAAWHDMVKPNRAASEINPAGVMVCTATFDEADGRTKLTVRIRFESAEISAAMQKMGMNEGWSESLERLRENLPAMRTGAQPEDRTIVTTRVFDAPRELVWRAFTEPEHVSNWWGPTGFRDTIQEMDVRAGGTWRHVLHGPDGKDYPNHSEYVEVVKPERLVFKYLSWPNHISTITFVDLGGRTRVTMCMVFESAERRNNVVKQHNAIEGAKQTFDRLAEHLGKM